MTDIDWAAGEWTTPPVRHEVRPDGFDVTAQEGSDAWRITSYGFIHDTEHALLAPFPPESAVEVTFRSDFSAQFVRGIADMKKDVIEDARIDK